MKFLRNLLLNIAILSLVFTPVAFAGKTYRGVTPAYMLQFDAAHLTADQRGDLGSATVNRVSGQWVTDADGKLILLRGDRTQYIQRTWQFDSTTAYWAATRADADTQNISAFGVSTATHLKCDNTADSSHFLKKNGETFNGRYAWYTLYAAKTADYDWIRIDIADGGETNGYTYYFDLTNGTFGTGAAIGAGALIKAYSDNTGLSAGEYRIGILVDLSAIYTTADLYVYVAEADTDITIAGTQTGKGIYIYNANLTALEGPEAIPLNLYTSDFSAGVEGWAATLGTVAGNIDTDADAAGVPPSDNWMRFTVNGDDAVHFFNDADAYALKAGHIYRYRVTYFIPSTNDVFTSFTANFIYGGSGLPAAAALNVLDAATTVDIIAVASGTVTPSPRIYTASAQDVGANDVIYIKAFIVDGITAPGGYAEDWLPGPASTASGATSTVAANIGITTDGLPFHGGQMVNLALCPRDLNNAGAYWNATTMTIASGTGTDGQAHDIKLTAAGANSTLLHDQLTGLANAAHSYSVYIKRVTGTGTVSITDDNSNWTDVTASLSTTAWYRAKISRTQTTATFGVKIATNTDAILFDMSEFIESQAYPSLYWVGIPDGDNTSPVGATTEAGSATNGFYHTMSTPFKAVYDTGGSGTTYVKLKMGYYRSIALGINKPLLSLSDAIGSLVYSRGTTDMFSSYDGGANFAQVSEPNYVYGDIIELCEIHPSSTDKFRIGYSLNGAAWVWGAEATYDGAFTLGTYLRWFFGNIYPMWVQDFHVYNRAMATTWIEAHY